MSAEPNTWTTDVGHGFNEHGYLADAGDELAAALVAWIAAEHDGDGDVALQLVLRRPDGTEVGYAGLPTGLLRELKQGLHREYAAREALTRAAVRQREMTALVVAARREHHVDDLGNLVAYALHEAVGRVYLGAVRLVHGRPGSWEADIVMRMAAAGGTVPPAGSWERLAELFTAMGQAKEDGGQVLANVFGGAAQDLGGLRVLAEGSVWAGDVWNLAKADNYDDQWEPW